MSHRFSRAFHGPTAYPFSLLYRCALCDTWRAHYLPLRAARFPPFVGASYGFGGLLLTATASCLLPASQRATGASYRLRASSRVRGLFDGFGGVFTGCGRSYLPFLLLRSTFLSHLTGLLPLDSLVAALRGRIYGPAPTLLLFKRSYVFLFPCPKYCEPEPWLAFCPAPDSVFPLPPLSADTLSANLLLLLFVTPNGLRPSLRIRARLCSSYGLHRFLTNYRPFLRLAGTFSPCPSYGPSERFTGHLYGLLIFETPRGAPARVRGLCFTL